MVLAGPVERSPPQHPLWQTAIDLKPEKPAIEVRAAESLVPVLQKLREAVLAGELDKVLKDARGTRRVGRKA